MTKNKLWKVETIKDLRKEIARKRLIAFLENVYSTIIPVALTYFMMKTNNPIFVLPILFIILVRVKRE